MPTIQTRSYPAETQADLARQGIHPILARILAARDITRPVQMESALAGLLPYHDLAGAEAMAVLLADAIAAGKKLLIIADYDADGATACAVGLRALRQFGARVDYLVPNRFEYGYGLTPNRPSGRATTARRTLITVDNGIASIDGVAEAHRLGMEVLVTDHHLPGDALPDAECIVNPNARMKDEGGRMKENQSSAGNQPSSFIPHPSSLFANLAGVGVIFYVMLALRAELRRRGVFQNKEEPNLAKLLDLVALGTVADVVKLDDNNRILVKQGLKRLRADQACAGIRALLQIASREPRRAGTFELGFLLGPRLNAAGRLDDMSLGIECLTTDDPDQAMKMARRLDGLNRERREIEAEMQQSALDGLDDFEAGDSYSLALYQPEWHQGVIGILAGRLKDKFHRPVIAFAGGGEGKLKGSGRSIPGLHLRDALDLLSKRRPDLIKRFGGHAMAAGLTIAEEDYPRFAQAFEETVRQLLTPADLEKIIETDGELAAAEIEWELARHLSEGIWGQGFPEPTFHGEFEVVEQRTVGERHLKLRLGREGKVFDAILFFHADPLPKTIRAVYGLGVNEYNGNLTLQLTVRHWEECLD